VNTDPMTRMSSDKRHVIEQAITYLENRDQRYLLPGVDRVTLKPRFSLQKQQSHIASS
jgi:hypothetical protein